MVKPYKNYWVLFFILRIAFRPEMGQRKSLPPPPPPAHPYPNNCSSVSSGSASSAKPHMYVLFLREVTLGWWRWPSKRKGSENIFHVYLPFMNSHPCSSSQPASAENAEKYKKSESTGGAADAKNQRNYEAHSPSWHGVCTTHTHTQNQLVLNSNNKTKAVGPSRTTFVVGGGGRKLANNCGIHTD